MATDDRETPSRTLRVANVLLDGRVGGPQRRVAQVAGELRREGLETLAVFPPMGEELPRYLEAEGVEWAATPLSRLRRRRPVLNLLRYLIRAPGEILRLRSLYRDRSVDLVHANGIFSLQVAISARVSGLPLVWHYNDTTLPAVMCTLARKLTGWLASVRVYSSFRVLRHHGDREDDATAVLHPCVDMGRFDPAVVDPGPARREIPALRRQEDGEVRLLAVGHLNPLKGYGHLLDALSRLTDLETRWRLVVIGAELDTNDCARRLREQAEDLALGERVVFAGASDRIPEALAAADVFVMSSVAESGPMVLLEAMAMSKAVVTTDVGLVDEVVEDGVNGLVVPPADADALSRALRRVVRDPGLRESLASRARPSLGDRFSPERAAGKHRQVYRRAAASSPSSR